MNYAQVHFQFRALKLLLVATILLFPRTGLAQDFSPREVLSFQNLQITRAGEGRDVIFIPGLNSSSLVFADICTALAQRIDCHLVQLPGFAGAAPMANPAEGFLDPMRDSLIRYIEEQALSDPLVVGHSLGGVLGLMIATSKPELLSALVIVDSLPFLPAAMYPGASVESMLPIAQGMRDGMISQSREQFEQGTPRQLVGMSNDPTRFDVLLEWSLGSDQETMAQAMYELYTRDLREAVKDIRLPTLVFGAWAAYEQFAATLEDTRKRYELQYENMEDVEIKMSEAGFHFLMWDDEEWMLEELNRFLSIH